MPETYSFNNIVPYDGRKYQNPIDKTNILARTDENGNYFNMDGSSIPAVDTSKPFSVKIGDSPVLSNSNQSTSATSSGGGGISLINNIGDIPAVGNWLKQQEADEEYESWMNRNTWFGSLQTAQEISNRYMKNHTERIPMVIEYYSSPGERVSVTMYINPNRISVTQQKIKSKAVTRGGIFYNHWGDDNPVMQLGGSVGLSGMSGIKKLEKIYHISGVLLAYGEDFTGPVYVDPETNLINNIMNGGIMGALGSIMSGGIKGVTNGLSKVAKGALKTAITGKADPMLRNNKAYNKVVGYMAAGVSKINGMLQSATRIPGSSSTGGSLAAIALQSITGSLLGKKESKDSQVVSWNDASAGWADINDELMDPWRPRPIWILFEDRVYIGHFDSFTYNRVAATPDITYDMKFTILREIVVTTYSPNLPTPSMPAWINGGAGLTQSQEIINNVEEIYGSIPVTNVVTTQEEIEEQRIKQAIAKAKIASNIQSKNIEYENKPEEAKKAILLIKETYIYEEKLAEDTGVAMSDERKRQLNDTAASIRLVANIPDSDSLYGTNKLTDEQRLTYYAYANPSTDDSDAKVRVSQEKARIKAKFERLKDENKLTYQEQSSMWNWIVSIHNVTGETTYEDWEKQLSPR